jgi:hypothetical protein
MKSIHAMSTIFAGWRIGPYAQAGSSHPVSAPPASGSSSTSGVRPKGGYEGEANTPVGRVPSRQPRVGIPTLLAGALLQGGSSTEPGRK